ncbi:MAG: ABC-2 transporter permease [Firmicutes bacterium]|nr:ABC-2 transporter permease [Bacillota bacterium]
MKKIKALLKLDFQLLAPYWKWWLMFIGFSLAIALLNQSGFFFIISLMIFAGTVMAFPYESTEKSNLGILYATLPTNRKSMVFARYVMVLIVFVISYAVAIGAGIIIDLAFHQTLDGRMILLATALAFAMYTISVGFQTPFLYRFGYQKGRIFMWIPIILVNIVLMLPAFAQMANLNRSLNVMATFGNHQTLTNIISFAVGVVAIIASYIASHIIYLRKNI